VAPAVLPMSRSRVAEFDARVLEVVERIQTAHPELLEVEIAVEEAPPAPRRDGSPDPVLLGSVTRGGPGPARITLYRRPIELRSVGAVERADLVADTVVELVAELTGLSPVALDADYDGSRDRAPMPGQGR